MRCMRHVLQEESRAAARAVWRFADDTQGTRAALQSTLCEMDRERDIGQGDRKRHATMIDQESTQARSCVVLHRSAQRRRCVWNAEASSGELPIK